MRIVSLLPSATEIVCLLGLREALVGRSHECDFPADVHSVPVMTFSELGLGLEAGSREIDTRVSMQRKAGLSLYGLHADLLAAAQPDLILTQELCDVCALSSKTVFEAVRDLKETWQGAASTKVLSLEPTSIEGIFGSILAIGEAAGVSDRAQRSVAQLRARVDALRERVRDVAHRPTVAALEWLDPPFTPGHWVPEQIELAGGRCVLGGAGQPSARSVWDDVIWVQPEMVVMMPCGFDVEGSAREFMSIASHEAWRDIPATYLNQLYVVNASAYFSRPGPRVIDGAEILAGLLHPNRVAPPLADQARRVSPLVSAPLREG